MVFLKHQVENKNGEQYVNYYFYHGNQYLGKADEGIEQIQANIRDELGDKYDPDKLESLMDEAEEKLEEKKEAEELSSDIENWDKVQEDENVIEWRNQDDKSILAGVSEDDRSGLTTMNVLDQSGSSDEVMVQENFGDFDNALDAVKNWMRDHPSPAGSEVSDEDVEYELNDSGYWERREDLEGVGQKWVWENTEDEGLTVEVEYDGEYFDVLEKHGGFTDNEVATGLESESEAIRRANARMEEIAEKQKNDLHDSSSVKNDLNDIEAKPPEIGDDYYHVSVRDSSDYERELVKAFSGFKNGEIYFDGAALGKIKYGKDKDEWEIHTVLIKKDKMDRSAAKEFAEDIAKNVDNKDAELNDVEMLDASNEELAEMFGDHWRSRPELWEVEPKGDGITLTFKGTGDEFIFGTYRHDGRTDYVEYILQGDAYEKIDGETQSLQSNKGNWNLEKAFDMFMGDVSTYQQKFSDGSKLNDSGGDFETYPAMIDALREMGRYSDRTDMAKIDELEKNLVHGLEIQEENIDELDVAIDDLSHNDDAPEWMVKALKDLRDSLRGNDTEFRLEDSGNEELKEEIEMYRTLVLADGREYLLESVQLIKDSEDLENKIESMDEDGGKHLTVDEIKALEKALEEMIGYDDGPRADSMRETLRDLEGYRDALEKAEGKGVLKDSDTWIYKGDRFADKLANEELIYQDWDEDDVANIDDREPLEPGNPEAQRVNEEILLSEELKNIEQISEKHRDVAELIDEEMDVHKARVKQPESILKKLHEKYSEEVTDIIGVTILAEDKQEVMEIAEDLKQKHDLFPIGEERADENHYDDDEFYRAYHLILAVENDGETYPAEVQIKTEQQAKLHGLAHEYYKRNEDMPELLEEKARQLESGEIDSVDEGELREKLP